MYETLLLWSLWHICYGSTAFGLYKMHGGCENQSKMIASILYINTLSKNLYALCSKQKFIYWIGAPRKLYIRFEIVFCVYLVSFCAICQYWMVSLSVYQSEMVLKECKYLLWSSHLWFYWFENKKKQNGCNFEYCIQNLYFQLCLCVDN